MGIGSKSMQLKLIKEGNATLDKTIEMSLMDEQLTQRAMEIQKETKDKDVYIAYNRQYYIEMAINRSSQTEVKMKSNCFYCNEKHEPRKCPAYGKRCNK